MGTDSQLSKNMCVFERSTGKIRVPRRSAEQDIENQPGRPNQLIFGAVVDFQAIHLNRVRKVDPPFVFVFVGFVD